MMPLGCSCPLIYSIIFINAIEGGRGWGSASRVRTKFSIFFID